MTNQEASKIIKDGIEDMSLDFADEEQYEALTMAIKALEQEPKMGHWIEHPEIETSTPEYLMFYECSECGNKQCFYTADTHRRNYCGECGCHMVEPQESEDKE